jgi:hypothetical protein
MGLEGVDLSSRSHEIRHTSSVQAPICPGVDDRVAWRNQSVYYREHSLAPVPLPCPCHVRHEARGDRS